MAQIANRTGHTADGKNFTKIAHNYIRKWYTYGFNYDSTPPHEEAEYNIKNSADLLYNLYADAELGLQLVKKQIYNIQSNYYPTVFNKYGVPLRNIGPDTIDTKSMCKQYRLLKGNTNDLHSRLGDVLCRYCVEEYSEPIHLRDSRVA